MRVLVTGSAGAIGRAAVVELRRCGHSVRGLDRVVANDDTDLALGSYVGRCDDTPLVADCVRGIDAVMHLAAVPNPLGTAASTLFANNTLATFVVLEQAALAGVRSTIVASSISALGHVYPPEPSSPSYVPIDEAQELLPRDPYGLSKQVDELTAAMMHRRYGLNVLIYRFPYVDTQPGLLARARKIQESPGIAAGELWAYLDMRDAVVALRLGIERGVRGLHVLNVVAPKLILHGSTEELMRQYHPAAERRGALTADTAPFASDAMLSLLEFEPSHLLRVVDAS